METTSKVCDECGKKHGLMIQIIDDSGGPCFTKTGQPIIMGSRQCFLAWQGKRWTRMEEVYLNGQEANR